MIKPNFLENGLDNSLWLGLVKIISIKNNRVSLKLCLAASKFFINELEIISPISLFLQPGTHFLK